MTYVLVLWTVVAMATHRDTQYDWRPIATFEQYHHGDALEKCQQAIQTLSIKPDRARCIKTK